MTLPEVTSTPWWHEHCVLLLDLGVSTHTNTETVGQWDTAQWDNKTSGTWSGIEPDWLPVDPCNLLNVSTTRGRDRWVDRFGASSASFSVQDREGRLSWDADDVDDQLAVRPGRDIRIRALHVASGVIYPVWRGWIESIEDDFTPSDVPIANFTAQDGYAQLAHINLLEQAPVGAGETSDERIHRLLDVADWPAAWRDVQFGMITVQGTNLARAIADDLGITADSEGGAVFADREGNIVFRNRDWLRTDPRATEIQAGVGGESSPALPPVSYLDLNAAGDYANTPDPPIPGPHTFYRATSGQAAATPKPAVVFDTENVLQVSIRIRMDDYSPSAGLALVDQYWVATDTGYKLALLSGTSAGLPHFIWSNGTAFLQRTGSTTLQSVVADGQPVSLRVTLTCNDGNGNNVVAFEYSLVDPPEWHPLGAPIVTAGTTSGNPNTNRGITIANQPGSSQPGVIRVEWAKATCDGVRQFDIDFRNKPLGTAPVTDAVGNVFSLNGGATIIEQPLITPSVQYGMRINANGDHATTGNVSHNPNANVYDLRVWAALDRWAPGASIQQQVLVKWNAGTNSREYFLNILQDGKLAMNWSTTGVNFSGNVASSVAVPFTAGQKAWIRAVLDTKNGTADPTVTFYTSTDDSPTPAWTQLGTVVTKTAFQGFVAMKDAPLTVINPTANAAIGKIFAARVIIDGFTGASPDFYMQESDVPFTDTQLNNWTLQGNAHIVGSPSGALDLRATVTLDDYTPANAAPLVSQWGAPQSSYWLQLATNGRLQFFYSTDGSNSFQRDSTVALPITDGTRAQLRVVFVPADGHAQNVTTFYYSTDDVTWTRLGAVLTSTGPITPVNSTRPIMISWNQVGAATFIAGRVHHASVLRNGVALVDPDFTALPEGGLGFVDRLGNAWALGGGAVIKTETPAQPLTACASSYTTTRDAGDIVNDVQVSRAGGTVQHYIDPTSISLYRHRTYSRTDYVCEDDTQVGVLGRRILAARASGQVRLPSLTVIPTDSPVEWQFVLSVDYGWRLQVTYPASSSGAGWTRTVLVQGIAHRITPAGWETELRVDDAIITAADTWDGANGWDRALWSEVL